MSRIFLGLCAFLLSVSAEARLDVFPSWVHFGQASVGSRQSRQVRVSNYSGRPVMIRSVYMWGDADFSTTNWCFSTLQTGQSCTIWVDFSPRTNGSRRSRIDISTDDGFYNVTVEGIGISTSP